MYAQPLVAIWSAILHSSDEYLLYIAISVMPHNDSMALNRAWFKGRPMNYFNKAMSMLPQL